LDSKKYILQAQGILFQTMIQKYSKEYKEVRGGKKAVKT
jgi:hypothetical protein